MTLIQHVYEFRRRLSYALLAIVAGGIIGFIWFEVDKELDWRIVSSKAAAKAFAQGVADPRYRFSWSPEMLPRLAG